MTNPNNAIGTPSGYGGRTSVFAYNALAQGYTSGIVSGFGAIADTNAIAILLGGSAIEKDVAIATNSYGEKAIIVNATTSSISVSLPSPTSTAKYASIVAYISSNAPVSSAVLDNTNACGIIAVVGTGANFPTETQIRSAIASDGGDSLLSPYVVLARASYSNTSITIDNSIPFRSHLHIRSAVETARSNSNTTIPISTTSYTTIPLAHLAGDNDVFKVQSNKIVIPAGIARVKASAQFSVWVAAAEGVFNTFVRIARTRNGTTTEVIAVPWLFAGSSDRSSRNAISIPSIVSGVQEGDEISLEMQVYAGPSSTAVSVHGGNTYLTVEEC